MRRNKFKMMMLLSFTVLIFVCLFTKSEQCVQGIKDGIMLCMSAVIPSLFPFMIVSQFVIKSGLADFFGELFGKLTNKLFKLPGVCTCVIIMALIGGFPVGAKMTCDLLENGKIRKNEAQRLNLFCINAGPAFIIGTVGDIFAGSRKLGVILFASVLTASLLTGFFSTVLYDGGELKRAKITSENVTNPINAFSSSLSDASKTMLGVCSWVIIFNAIIKCIASVGSYRYITVICALLEVTSGIKMSFGVFPVPVFASILSFAGLSVHCQIFPYVQKSGLDFKLFYTARIVCAVLSALICNAILYFFPFETDVFLSNSAVTASAYSVSLPSAIALIVMCCSLIFELDTNKKIC